MASQVSEITLQDTAKMMAQVNHLGFLPDLNLTVLLIAAYNIRLFVFKMAFLYRKII